MYLHFTDLYTYQHRTNDKSQQAILNLNNHATKLLITRCVRQHMMDSVLKSFKPRSGLTGNGNHITLWVTPQLHELLCDNFQNYISNNSDFSIVGIIEIQNQMSLISHINLKTVFAQKNRPCITALSVFSAALTQAWHDIWDFRNGSHCLLTVRGWLCGVEIRANCVKYI